MCVCDYSTFSTKVVNFTGHCKRAVYGSDMSSSSSSFGVFASSVFFIMPAHKQSNNPNNQRRERVAPPHQYDSTQPPPLIYHLVSEQLIRQQLPASSPSRGGDVTVYVYDINQPFFLFCSCVYFCLYGPLDCSSFQKCSRKLSVFSLCSHKSLIGPFNYTSL